MAATLAASASAAFPGGNGLIVRLNGTGRDAYALVVSRPNGAGERTVVPPGRNAKPQWSPDGTQIAFEHEGKVAVVAANGSALTELGEGTAPAWSEDGSELAFNRFDGIGVMNADGTSYRDLLPDEGAGDLSKWDPSWSPDGRRLAYTRGSGEWSGQIWVVRRDGTGARAVTRSRGEIDSVPAWSPAGTWIAFQRYVACSGGSCRNAVFVIRPNGTGIRRVALDAASPAWSPDGARIAFTRRVGGSSEVFTVRVTGRDLRRVTRNTVSDLEPDWQPT